MQQRDWIGRAAGVFLAVGLVVGCGDRVEQSAPPSAGPSTAGAQRPETAPAVGLKTVTLNVKGMS